MASVMARPISGSATGAPRPTAAALATTPSETKPSTRAWLPSAVSAAEARRRPAGRRGCAAPRAQPDLRARLVSDEADCAGQREDPEVGQVLRVDQPLHRRVERDARGDEDREDDRHPGELLAARAAREERDAERDRRERVAAVVDQIREQR